MGCVENCRDVVTVDADAGNGVKFTGLIEIVGDAPFAPMQVARILIVFADKHQGESIQRGQVKRFVNVSFFEWPWAG